MIAGGGDRAAGRPTEAQIRAEMRKLKRMQNEAKSGYGAGCALLAHQALEWVLKGNRKTAPPSAFAGVAESAGQYRNKLEATR
jgi:hypothetical protein